MRFSISLFMFATTMFYWPHSSASFAQSVTTPKEQAELETKVETTALQQKFEWLQWSLESEGLARARFQVQFDEIPEIEQSIQIQIDALNEELSRKQVIYDTNLISALVTRRVALMIEITGLEARRDASARAAYTDEKLLQLMNTQIEKLNRLLQTANQSLEKKIKLYDSGSITSVELADAENAVVMAELRLLEKQQQFETMRAGAGVNGELTLSLAEKEAQLLLVDQLLSEAAATRSSVTKLRQLESRLERLQTARELGVSESLRKQETEYADLQRQLVRLRVQLENLNYRENNDEN
ncbi:MAG TPA: hypothetical protein PKD64_16255 [Pirellulaceae bacterium]|nr:hypothetical protein [Pirellulaceae bacterium]HMO93742.1 hypothetical protein [Pirellulaceae bacterium]HMP69921.1 hypothetical protein [Pirellulaceae bacterium]